MINLYPGPSKLNSSVSYFLSHIPEVVTMNHRSDLFMELYSLVKEKLFKKLHVPTDYELGFTSSATECWEIISQSFTKEFHHVSNGAFGEKWHTASQKIGVKAVSNHFDINELPHVNSIIDNVICLTHCETSNGTYLPSHTISSIKRNNPTSIIAIDATSSLGGIHLNFNDADLVFASVQKCLGLPSGLGLLILSPKAIQEANSSSSKHYNSISNIVNNAKKHQTTHTPNILGIYLLNRLLDVMDDSIESEMKIRNRHTKIQGFYTPNFLTSNQEVLSPTVMALSVQNPTDLITTCTKESIILGKGYGDWKESSVRVANFPAHTLDELDQAFKIINRY